MADSWQYLGDEHGDERRLFARAGAWLAAAPPATVAPAAPANRLRSVLQVRHGGRTWYVKRFTATQWQNRLRFACTAPRARDDAERELRVTQALRQAGHAAPRPVAVGRADGCAYYVCAALPGQALSSLLAEGTANDSLVRRVAQHCGALLRAGFWLPDLSADHVFVDPQQQGGGQLAVLDLHNGRLGSNDRVPRTVCRRTLRRFAKSVRHLDLPWPRVLRFAVRLLRAAGRGPTTRRILRQLPPWSTASRYERHGKAEAYATRNPARHQRELRLLAEVFPGRPGERVLDLPCGAGRLAPWLTARGCQVVAADGAFAMLQQARREQAQLAQSVQADALAWPFADRTVDGAVVFRFLHHLPAERADQVIAEACRVARRFVVVSFFHPCSAHHLRRRLAGNTTRFARRLGAVAATFAAHGFVRHRHAAELPFAKDLWLASFVRQEPLR